MHLFNIMPRWCHEVHNNHYGDLKGYENDWVDKDFGFEVTILANKILVKMFYAVKCTHQAIYSICKRAI